MNSKGDKEEIITTKVNLRELSIIANKSIAFDELCALLKIADLDLTDTLENIKIIYKDYNEAISCLQKIAEILEIGIEYKELLIARVDNLQRASFALRDK